MAAPLWLRCALLAALVACVGCEDSPVALDERDLAELGIEREALITLAEAFQAADTTAAAAGPAVLSGDSALAVRPVVIATAMVERAEARLALITARAAGEGESRRLERATRLARGARQALESGDLTLAARRAYYAGQLLTRD